MWAIAGTGAGRVAGATFRGVENLAPGSGDNVFGFANGAGVRGRSDGDSGRNAWGGRGRPSPSGRGT